MSHALPVRIMPVRSLLVAVVSASALAVAGPVTSASAHSTGYHDNCTQLNKKWAHGVGRRNAVDRTSGTKVRNFYRNTAAYNTAMDHNGTLDRDRDGIACEKR